MIKDDYLMQTHIDRMMIMVVVMVTTMTFTISTINNRFIYISGIYRTSKTQFTHLTAMAATMVKCRLCVISLL